MKEEYVAQLKACVTGAAGFVGSHLVRYLKDRDYWVRAVDWQHPKFGDTVADEHDWDCDLRYGHNAARALAGGFDHVYALAADMGGAGFVFTGRHDLEIMTNNTRINLNTLAAAKKAGVGRYLFSSSACIYPQGLQASAFSSPLKEEFAYPADPDSEYGWEKLYAERLCQVYGKSMNIRIARFHNIYGPQGSWNDGREKAPAALCRKVAEAKALGSPHVEIWGDGWARRSFCYIDDCLEMLHRLMLSGHDEPLNIGTDEAIAINDLAHLAADIAGIEIDLVHIPGPQGVRGRNADLSKMRNILEYEPQVSLEVGLACLYGWIEAQVEKESK
jgi:nucleoside-diphosphate-sugar epimerase